MMTKSYRTFEKSDDGDDSKTVHDKVSMLEKFVLSPDPADFYKTLIQGSDMYRFFRCNEVLKHNDAQLIAARSEEIRSFVKDIKNSQSKVLQYEVLFRWLLNQIDFETDPAARTQLMHSFCREFVREAHDLENYYKKQLASHQQSQGADSKQLALLEEALLVHRTKPDFYKAGSSLDHCYLQEFDLNPLLQAVDSSKRDHSNKRIVEDTRFLSTQNNAVQAIAWWLKDQDASSQRKLLSLFAKMTKAQVFTLLQTVPSLLESEDVIEHFISKKLELADRIDSLLADTSGILQLLRDVEAVLLELQSIAKKKEIFTELLSYFRLVRLHHSSLSSDPSQRLDLEALVSYLTEDPAIDCDLLKESKKSHLKGRERLVTRFTIIPRLPAVGEAELSKLILDHLHQIKLNAPTDAEKKLLDLLAIERHTQKLLITERLLRGELVQEVMSYFSEIELNMLRDSKVLRLVEENKHSFGPTDRVSLKLEIKAIKNLIVNVFQVNTLNYYAKNQTLVDSKIDLSGLLPSKQITVEYSHQNMTRHFETFDFEQITATERGIFIVEFIGNGLATRALIKKGGLNLVQVGEDNGIQFMILDESTNICRGADAYILLNSKQYLADDRGHILLPYQQEAIGCFVQVVYKQYSELYRLTVPGLQISLDYSLLYNEEALVGGEVAVFLLSPKLYFNQRVVSLDYLRSVGLFITALDADGVANSQSFNDLTLSSQESVSVEYRLPKKIARISFDLRGEVRLTGHSQEVKLSEKRTLNFTQTSNSKNVFLSYSKASGFYVSTLGLNGEPVQAQPLSSRLSNFLLRSEPNQQVNSQTAEDGKLTFGELSGVHELTVTAPSRDFQQRTWPLRNYMRYKSIPQLMSIVEGEELMLPALHEEIGRVSHLLLKTDGSFSQVFEDCSAAVVREKGMLFLTGLNAGYYRFTYAVGAALDVPSIQLTVLQGRRWEGSEEFLINERVIQRLQNQSNYLSFDELKVEDSELSLRVFSNQPEHVKVHLLAYNFLPANFQHIKKSFESLTVQEPRTEYQISSNYNEYLSEKEISDEVKYVIARQNLDIFMGNTLERPTGLLKKEFNKTTAQDSQSINTDKDFKHCSARPDANQIRSLKVMQYLKKPVFSSASLDVTAGFLRNRGALLPASEVDADGRVSIDISQVKHFPYFVVVIEDRNNFIYEVVCNSLQDPVVPLRDIRLRESRSQDKYFIHQRSTQLLSQGQSHEIEDPKNTEHCIVADLQTVYLMAKTISSSAVLNEWDFLINWHSMSPKEKLQKYNKYLGHELNVFTYFKDRKFWELVVKKHMANKTNKTFIDYFILEDTQHLLQHYSPQGVARLNDVELCLLVYFLKKSGETQKARTVRDYLDSRNQRLKATNDLNFNIRFDSTLRFKASSPEDLEDNSKTLGSKGGYQSTGFLASGGDEELVRASVKIGSTSGKRHGGLPQKQHKDCNTDHMFNPIGSTFEFCETDYCVGSEESMVNSLTQFWLALADQIVSADSLAEAKLLSEKFILANGNEQEMLFMLALLDLPPVSCEVQVSRSESKLEVRAAHNCIVFCKQLIEKNTEKLPLDLIVAQKFFDPTAAGSAGGEAVTEFVRGKVYGCKATVTNISNNREEVELVVEVPQGAIPIGSSNFVKTEKFEVGSYETKTLTIQFYFPAAGQFSCYPATVGKAGKIIRSAEIRAPLVVLAEAKKAVSEVSLQSLVDETATEQVLQWLLKANLLEGLHQTLRPLLADAAFHERVMQVYRGRLVFDRPLWLGAVHHGDLEAFRELLQHTFKSGPVDIKEFTIYYLKTGSFHMDCFKAREYDPLVNPRAHFIGDHKHNILNKEFLDTYMRFLKYLVDKPQRTTRDRLQLASYLLLQDRIPEAINQVNLIESKSTEAGELQLQLDYLLAFASLSQDKTDSFKVAKELCSRYINYPVITWRNKFIEMSNIIAECEGDIAVEKDSAEDKDTLKKLIKAEPVLQGAVRDASVVIKHKNLKQAAVNYFVVDIEVKFSIDPFSREESSTFSYINPNFSQPLDLLTNDNSHNQLLETTHAIPEQLRRQNLVIQVKSAGLSFFVNYFSSSLAIHNLESLGQIKVLDLEGKPVEKAYVKVFAQKRSGQSSFHKDGYTDFKGNFDYLTLNLEDTDSYQQLSILVFSKQHGSKIIRVQGREIKKQTREDSDDLRCKIESEEIHQLQQQLAREKKSKYAIA